MAASSENGTQKFWWKGRPAMGAAKTGNDSGTIKFWFKGAPAGYIYPVVSTYQPRNPAINFQDPGVF